MFIVPRAEKIFLSPTGRHVEFLRYVTTQSSFVPPSLRGPLACPHFCVLCVLCGSFGLRSEIRDLRSEIPTPPSS